MTFNLLRGRKGQEDGALDSDYCLDYEEKYYDYLSFILTINWGFNP
jgi:hypothetical protein